MAGSPDIPDFSRLAPPAALVAHDAGAANILIGWLGAAGLAPERACMEGPAAELWKAAFPDCPTAPLAETLEGAKTLVSGTGWASMLEHEARRHAAESAQRSIAIIDHWVNYPSRFEREGRLELPDTIWVADGYARAIAEREFPGTPVVQFANVYLREQAAGAGPVPAEGDILFVAEPARSNWGADRPGEFQALDHFMAHRGEAGIGETVPLRLRAHPSDPAGKYDAWLADHANAALDNSPDMAAALRPARWCAGLNSVGLVIALEAGREAISALPPNAPPCSLPHDDIRRL